MWTIADTIRRFTVDPNIRILIANETASNARNFLSKIRSVVERNEIYQWLFPEVIPDFGNVRWTQDQIELRRTVDFPEATVEVIGVGGASTSRHYNLIKEDDLVGKEASESSLVMEKAIDQHKLAESLLNSPRDEIQTYGTRWAPNDLVEWMYANEPDLDHLRLEVLRPDKSPLWPSRFTLGDISKLRQKYGPAMFALQYENRCLGEGVTDFQEDWLRYYTLRWLDDDDALITIPSSDPYRVRLSNLERITLVDPCLSPDSGDARTAVVTLGLTPTDPFDIVLLGARAEKVAPPRTIEIAHEEFVKWDPTSVCIETVAGQVAFFYWCVQKYPDMPMRQLKTEQGRRKRSRIRSFGTYGEQGRFYVSTEHVDFIEEWIKFNETSKPVDLLDACAYGPQVWCPPDPNAPKDDFDDYDGTFVKVRPDGRSRLTGY